jgi:hypothetical protein
MASKSEEGYGARLQNAQTMKSYLAGFANYNPARPEDTVASFEKLLNDCADVNTSIASLLQSYTLVIKNRSDAFTGSQANSIKFLLSPIAKAVQAQYGKDSREYTSIAVLVGKMRSTTLTKTPTTEGEPTKERLSQSEMSYGSQLQNFKDLVASLAQLNDYKPAKDIVSITNLQNLIAEVGKLNEEVIAKTYPLSQAREQRKALFEELNTRAQRIKSYVSAAYGNKSTEYKAISKLKI